MKIFQLLVLTTLFIVLTACAALTALTPASTGGNGEVAAPTEETFGPLPTEIIRGNGAAAGDVHNEAQLQNLEYTVASLDGMKVTLSDGLYENADEHVFVSYIGTRGYSDLDGDRKEEAIVLLGANYGASGVFTDLAIVSDVDGMVTNTATVMLGDRIDIRDLTIADGQIHVTMVTQGPNEPMCCGTLEVAVTYALEDGALVETAREEIGYLQGVENFYFPETFNNITIRSSLVPSGTITLTDGKYEDEAAQVSVELDGTRMQFGDLNGDGKDEAILLLYTNTGGSGRFTELLVAGAADSQVFEIATVTLGDRVTVYSVLVNESKEIVVDMLTQGPNDPMCCPTSRVEAVYALKGETLEEISVREVEVIPAAGSSGLTPESLTLDFAPVAESMEGALVPHQPNTEGPVWQGMPEHVVYSFNGEEVSSFAPDYPQIRLFPVDQYVDMYYDAEINPIREYLLALEAQLDGQSTELPSDMSEILPFLPVFNAGQDLAANVRYVDFDGGRGYRFIFHYGQAPDIFLSGQIFYGYQGLTDDGKTLVVAMFPLTTELLPASYEEVPQELMDGIWGGGFEEYRNDTIRLLDGAAPDQFTPDLEALDAMMAGMTISPR